jgi:transcriptional regulator of acetoin/glycerol metabolism
LITTELIAKNQDDSNASLPVPKPADYSFEYLTVPVGITLDEMAKLLTAATLRQQKGSVRKAAKVLGIDRTTLYKKIKQYGIESPSGQ